VSVDRLRARAMAALGHRDIAWIKEFVPAKYQDEPAVILKLLISAAEGDPSLADAASFCEAHGALTALQGARDLGNRASAMFHHPKIRAEFSEAELAEAWRNPGAAYAKLVGRSAAGRMPAHLQDALGIIGEVRQYADEQGVSEPAASPERVPSGAAGDSRYAGLIKASAERRLSSAEQQVLTRLAEGH
jgi:hypothetical protein